MLVKIYWAICAAFLLAALVFFLTGNMTTMALVVFGFTSFGIIFMGMISVLPATMSHPAPPKEAAIRPASAYPKQVAESDTVRPSSTGWFYPKGVETRELDYR